MATKERWAWCCGRREGTGMDRLVCSAGSDMPAASEAEAREELRLHFEESPFCHNSGGRIIDGTVWKLKKGQRWHPPRRNLELTVNLRKGSPLEECPFCDEDADFFGERTGTGACYVMWKLFDEELICPVTDSSGRGTEKPPKTCPIKRGSITVEEGRD